MASSGSFSTNQYNDGKGNIRGVTFQWSIKSQSIANNTTTISWSLVGNGSGGWMKAGNFTVVIDGNTVYNTGSNDRIYLYVGTVVASGEVTFSHDTQGNRSFSASVTAGIYTYAKNCSGSGTWSLTQIPRYATVSQSYSSITETTITMKWTSDSVCDYIWYSSNNGSTWTGVNVSDGKSGSYTISGLSPNTTYKVKTRVRRKDSQLTTDSSAASYTTYSYPYAQSMPNFTIGDMLTVRVYNPLGRTFKITMIAADNSELTASSSYSGTSVTGFKGDSYVTFLYKSIPSAKSGTYKIKITYGSNSTTKTGGTYTINTSACTPSIGTVAYKDTTASVINITGNNQKIVRNQSVVQYTASGLTAKNSATIRSCSLAVNGKSYTLTLSGSSASGGNAKIDSGSNVSAVFTVTDSRGLTASKSINVTMLDWSVPSAICTLQRHDNFYTATDITVDANYSYVDGKNTISITYQAKKTSASSYSVSGTLQDNVTATFDADNQSDWNVVVTLTDRFGGKTTYNLFLSRGTPIIYFDRLKSSVGVNCFPQNEHSLEVDGYDLFFHNGDTVTLQNMTAGGYLSASSTGIQFSIVLPRLMNGVTPTLTEMRLNVRNTSGGYVLSSAYVDGGYNVMTDSAITVTVQSVSANVINFRLDKTSAFNGSNNTPVGVQIHNITLSFA